MLCGVTATLGSNPSATATAARPHWGRAVLLCLACMCGVLVAPLVFRAPEGPAAREARASLRSAPRLEAWPGSAAAHRHRDQAPSPPAGVAAWPAGPSGALHTGGAVSLTCACASARCPARPRHRPLISHVIPLRLVQSLNLHRWNCNVFGVSRKMTTINYVRNLGGGAAGSLMCALRVDSLSGQALPPLTGTAAGSLYSLWASRGSRVLSFWGALVRVVTNVVNPRCFSCGFLSRCYKRRQSEGFFAENGGFLA